MVSDVGETRPITSIAMHSRCLPGRGGFIRGVSCLVVGLPRFVGKIALTGAGGANRLAAVCPDNSLEVIHEAPPCCSSPCPLHASCCFHRSLCAASCS